MPKTDDAIRLRAYYLFLAREQAGRDGTALDDWLHAEAELVSEGQEQGSPIGEAPKLPPSPAPPITTARAPKRR